MSYLRKTLLILVIIAFIVIGLFLGGINLYADWLWFLNLNLEQVFLTILTTKIWVRLVIAGLFALFIYINLRFTRKKILDFLKNFTGSTLRVVADDEPQQSKWLSKKRLNWLFLVVSIVLGFFTSSISTGAWEIVQKYLHKSPFGTVDPIFNQDIGFYIFDLPFLQLAYSLLTGVIVLTGIIVGIVYLLLNFRSNHGTYRLDLSEKLHLSALAVIFFAVKAFGYRLQMYNLLYSPRGVVFGASYTDVNVQLFALQVLLVVVGLLALFTLINIFMKNMKLIYIGIGVWVLFSIILGGVYPGIIQKYRVEPNEIEMEKPYIAHNIHHTLQAYGLSDIEVRNFPATTDLSLQDVEGADDIIENIRLWDWRPLQKTYGQLQELRPYYDIKNVDIDRYVIDGVYRQVMLAPREMNQAGLPERAQTWINQVLKFTHGMGVVMSPVNVVTPEGLPELYIKNIPPTSLIDLEITQPRIYFGERTNNYVIANSKNGEFDYSESDPYFYTGQGGIPIKNFWRRLAFAIKYSTVKFLLSSDVVPESKVLFDRDIMTRVKKIAPFLKYDDDPYIVVNNGNLFWIIDGYTITDYYPYSEPVRGWGNYVRNSVKIIVDAYHGTADFYISDPNDPLIQTYAKIFPDLFKPLDTMPGSLRAHLRYPEDLFSLQSNIYSTYHMQNPVTFFNKEDQWNLPNEKYAGQTITVQPYYLITRLPNEKNLEFILFQPFTPAKKNNMVSWLVAKSDGENYGKLIQYSFPRNRTIYGPMMIEARIDQNSLISQQLTLWDQKGSSVIRGNLLTIPIKNSVLYVEPIFLQSQETQLPELKRVIVAFGDEVIMEPTLRGALERIFVKDDEEQQAPIVDQLITEAESFEELLAQIEQLILEMNKDLTTGDLAGFGQKWDDLLDLSKKKDNISQ